jgi:hypothetical protein
MRGSASNDECVFCELCPLSYHYSCLMSLGAHSVSPRTFCCSAVLFRSPNQYLSCSSRPKQDFTLSMSVVTIEASNSDIAHFKFPNAIFFNSLTALSHTKTSLTSPRAAAGPVSGTEWSLDDVAVLDFAALSALLRGHPRQAHVLNSYARGRKHVLGRLRFIVCNKDVSDCCILKFQVYLSISAMADSLKALTSYQLNADVIATELIMDLPPESPCILLKLKKLKALAPQDIGTSESKIEPSKLIQYYPGDAFYSVAKNRVVFKEMEIFQPPSILSNVPFSPETFKSNVHNLKQRS